MGLRKDHSNEFHISTTMFAKPQDLFLKLEMWAFLAIMH